MGRAPCCDKANVKKGPWAPEEDAKLKSYIEQHGTGGNWITLPHKIGLKRCGKSCRLRWLNYLRPNLKHGGFSEEEDNIICSLYINVGSRWSIIASQLPGRTDNDIKNYWNTRLKKKLFGKQRDEEQRACGGGGLNEEVKEVGHNAGILGITDDNVGRLASWPRLPASTPVNILEGRRFTGTSGTTDESYHFTQVSSSMPAQTIFDASTSLVPPPLQVNTCGKGSQAAANSYSTELDEMFWCSSLKLEDLDCFRGTAWCPNNLVSSYAGSMQQCPFEETTRMGV